MNESLICTHVGLEHDWFYEEPDLSVGDKGSKTCRVCGTCEPLTEADLEDDMESMNWRYP